jgi:hypothetical protein
MRSRPLLIRPRGRLTRMSVRLDGPCRVDVDNRPRTEVHGMVRLDTVIVLAWAGRLRSAFDLGECRNALWFLDLISLATVVPAFHSTGGRLVGQL